MWVNEKKKYMWTIVNGMYLIEKVFPRIRKNIRNKVNVRNAEIQSQYRIKNREWNQNPLLS